MKFEKQRRENALEKRKKINGKANMKRGTVKKKNSVETFIKITSFIIIKKFNIQII